MADETTTKSPTSTSSPPAKQTGTAGSSGASSGGELSGAERDRKIRLRGVTEAAGQELDALGVDPRLDNRTGDQRPTANPVPKAQQFDGPEVGHFGEHADGVRAEFEEAVSGPTGEPLGMRSLGQHGRGEDE